MAAKRSTSYGRTAKPDPAQKLFEERFASRARYEGDADAKKVAAAARRIATGLRNAQAEFGRYLDRAQLDTLSAAALVMSKLATDASHAGVLSRRAKADHDLQQQRLREASADAVAAELWGAGPTFNRVRFLADCRDLVEFIDLSHGTGGSGDWMRANIPGREPGVDEIAGGYSGPQLMRLLQSYEKQPGPELLLKLRRRAAEYMDAIRKSRLTAWHRNATLADYEAWKASRVKIKVPR